ncbi:MAG: hypothetical protein ABIK79_15595, partial [Chloroflexota bacterium]
CIKASEPGETFACQIRSIRSGRLTFAEVFLDCGMIYYDAAVLKEIERRFFAIQNKTEEPDRYIEMPAKAYA